MDVQNTTLSVEELSPLIKEYEYLTQALQSQIEYYKAEHEELRNEIKSVTDENSQLSVQIKDLLQNQTVPDLKPAITENHLIDNLQKQLSLTLQEKNSAVDLWQTALKEIDLLEDKLRITEKKSAELLSSSKISSRQSVSNAKSDENINKELDTIKKMLNNRNYDTEKVVLDYKQAVERGNLLQIELEKLRGEIEELNASKNECQETLEEYQQYIEKLKNSELESAHILENIVLEKEKFELKEQQYKDEISHLKKTMVEIIKEAGEKMKSEVNYIKEKYDEKINPLIGESNRLKDELADTNSKLSKATSLINELQKKLEAMKDGTYSDVHEELNIKLQKKFEKASQELIVAERKNIQLIGECENLRLDINAMARGFERDIKEREMKNYLHQQRIQSLEVELIKADKALMKTAAEFQQVNTQVRRLQSALKQKSENDQLIQKLLVEMSSIHNLKTEDAHNISEHLNNQFKLNKKWKKEAEIIINRLQKRIKDLKKEISALELENKNLKQELTLYKT